jgi:hypothetical protein
MTPYPDRSKSLRRVFIYSGDLAHNIEASGAFDQLIAFEQFLQPLSPYQPETVRAFIVYWARWTPRVELSSKLAPQWLR